MNNADNSMVYSSLSPDPPLNVFSYISLITFLAAVVFVIYPFKIPISRRRKWFFPLNIATAPLLAILFLLATTSIKPRVVVSGLVGIPSLQPYSILILFFSIAYICISLDQTGFLRFAALWALRRAKSNGRHIFAAFFLLTSFASALTSNDAVILTATPFLIHFAESAKIEPPSAFLMSEFVTANIASMFLYIGNPTNVVVAQANSVTFAQYSAWMVLPTIMCTVLAFVILRYMLFSSERYIPLRINVDLDALSPRDALTDPNGAIFGGALLTACLVTLMVTSIFGTPVWEVTLPFACASLARDVWYDISQHGKDKNKAPLEIKITSEPKMDELLVQPRDENDKDENLQSELTLTPSVSSTKIDEALGQQREENGEDESVARPQSDLTLTPSSPLARTGARLGKLREENDKEEHLELQPLDTIPPLAEPEQNVSSVAFPKYMSAFADRFPTVYGAFLRLPWAILPFALGMFVLVESLTETGWTAVLAKGLGYLASSPISAIFSMGVISLVLCSFLNNIPATILLTRVLLHPSFTGAVANYVGQSSLTHAAIVTGSTYALVAGSNLGACLTIAASLAGIMWQQLLKNAGIKAIGAWRFFLWNLIIAPVLISGACLVLCAEVYVIFR